MPSLAQHRFHRPDIEIFFDARRTLDRCLHTPTTVHVQVWRGVANLTGRVRWRDERAEAQAAVGQIPGVVRVMNRICVVDIEGGTSS